MSIILKLILFVPAVAVSLTSCGNRDEPELVMFCAAGMKSPVTRIAEQFEKERSVKVRLQFGGSGTLLGNLQIAAGDIYLAADSSYIDEASKRGFVSETMPVAFMKAGFGVPQGNPKDLASLTDLKKPDLRAAIGNPDATSVGKFTKKILSRHGVWTQFTPAVQFPTVNELANALKLDTVDVAILWDAVAHQYPDVDFVSLPEFDAEEKDITVAVLKNSQNQELAVEFCRYLTSAEKGLVIFQEEGYRVPVQ